ncbi:39S ribosomal protein L52, mitochondrial isoform X2 [Galleria mellonella]|uniref:Large ribosomal subunit protein mL52 n=1 Tax=Galleria mellonella TaxID=7137 RepID=A0ABM3N5X4_GALME|nr:39S ribosomal protein L52, mitochondrial isoform X2 [Galleria mellonella]
MSLILRIPYNAVRSFSSTLVRDTKQWRVSQGLPANRNAEGILTDGPDYTFLDGRPTPLLHKQKLRMLKQREYAAQIVEMCAELDFAKERHQNLLKAEAEEKQKYIESRLKPKGNMLSRNSKK